MTPWKDRQWLLVDTETTGIGSDARIVELAMVTLHQGCVVQERHTRVNPGIPIPPEASAVHGITDADVRDCPTMAQLAERCVVRARNYPVIVAYNAPFDMDRLCYECPGWAGVLNEVPVLDVLPLMKVVDRFAKGKGRFRLGAVCERHGIDLTNAHSAVADATAAGRLLWMFRDRLPDDATEAWAQIAAWKSEQDAEYEAWKAKNSA